MTSPIRSVKTRGLQYNKLVEIRETFEKSAQDASQLRSETCMVEEQPDVESFSQPKNARVKPAPLTASGEASCRGSSSAAIQKKEENLARKIGKKIK